jgi:hypothetical protein
MLRLTEAVMLASPLVAFIAWRLLASYRLPTRVMAAAVVAVGVLTASLIWFGLGRALAPGAAYMPARLGPGGEIISPGVTR